jgi:hypothetical protein
MWLRTVSDELGEVLRPEDLGAVDVEAFYRIAEAFFGFEGLDVDDLFGVGRGYRMTGDDLVFCTGSIWHVVGFDDYKSGSLADLAVH